MNFKDAVPPKLGGLSCHYLARERAEAERAARLEREAAATAERVTREAADCVTKIEELAIFAAKDVEAFLDTPLPGYDGKTSRELAADSVNGFMAVQAGA